MAFVSSHRALKLAKNVPRYRLHLLLYPNFMQCLLRLLLLLLLLGRSCASQNIISASPFAIGKLLILY